MALTKEQIVEQLKGKDVAVKFVEIMDLVVQLEASVQLLKEHRELLGNAVRNYIGDREKAWGAVSAEEQGAEKDEVLQQQLKEKRESVEAAIRSKLSKTVIPWVEKQVSSSTDDEHKVFNWTLLGSMNALLSMTEGGDSRFQAVAAAEKYFKLATERANSKLSDVHVYRLNLALYFSCFYHDILNAPDKARELAKAACDKAEAVVIGGGALSAEAASIKQKLRDRLTEWTSDSSEEPELPDES